MNIILKEKILFPSAFSFEVGDLAENVRLEGPEKQVIVSYSGQEKQAISLL